MSPNSSKASSPQTTATPDSTASASDAEVLPLHLRDFLRALIKYGIHEVPCGGGYWPRPKWAVYCLEPKYGRERLQLLCREFCRLPEPVRDQLPESTLRTAYGMLYHIGDAATLEELEAFRNEECQPIAPLCGPNRPNDPDRETLIDALRWRLALPPEEKRGGRFGDIFFSPDCSDPEDNEWGLALLYLGCFLGCLSVIVAVVWLGYRLVLLLFSGG